MESCGRWNLASNQYRHIKSAVRDGFPQRPERGKPDRMCYSAMVKERLRFLARGLLAEVDWGMLEELLRRRLERNIKVSRALEAKFVNEAPGGAVIDVERLAREHIEGYRTRRVENLERKIFKQKRRGGRSRGSPPRPRCPGIRHWISSC